MTKEQTLTLFRTLLAMARCYQRHDDDPKPMFFWSESELLEIAEKKIGDQR